MYTSSDEQAVNPRYQNRFGANLISNTYTNGIGIMIFDGGVTSIGDMAFYDCSSLASINIPNSVTSIGHSAFYGCSALTSITCEAVTPPTLDSGNRLSNVTAVYVPAESIEAYKTATNWSYYSREIQPISDNTE